MAANTVARWDGTSWHPFGSGMGGYDYPAVSSLALAGADNFYAGGNFTAAGGRPSGYIAQWAGPTVVAPIEHPTECLCHWHRYSLRLRHRPHER